MTPKSDLITWPEWLAWNDSQRFEAFLRMNQRALNAEFAAKQWHSALRELNGTAAMDRQRALSEPFLNLAKADTTEGSPSLPTLEPVHGTEAVVGSILNREAV